MFITAKISGGTHRSVEQVSNLGCGHTVEYYTAVKMKNLLPHATWMNLKNMLVEKTQLLKITCNIIPFFYAKNE